jgi:hypothetical protein
MSALTDPIDVRVTGHSVLDERLEAAVRPLQGDAVFSKSRGILVTTDPSGLYWRTASRPLQPTHL